MKGVKVYKLLDDASLADIFTKPLVLQGYQRFFALTGVFRGGGGDTEGTYDGMLKLKKEHQTFFSLKGVFPGDADYEVKSMRSVNDYAEDRDCMPDEGELQAGIGEFVYQIGVMDIQSCVGLGHVAITRE
jgi:hypothetical protein